MFGLQQRLIRPSQQGKLPSSNPLHLQPKSRARLRVTAPNDVVSADSPGNNRHWQVQVVIRVAPGFPSAVGSRRNDISQKIQNKSRTTIVLHMLLAREVQVPWQQLH